MGLGGISIWQLLIILLIVVMIFGTKRLKNIGSDLGGAVKGFKKSMEEDDEKSEVETQNLESSSASTEEAETKADTESKL